MRAPRHLLLPLSLLVLLTAAVRVPLPVFVERPGSVLSLDDNVTVADGEDLEGDFLLTTVNLRRGTVVDVAAALLNDAATLLPADLIVPPGESTDEYFAGQRTVFDVTADVAAAVGLDEAGYDVADSDITGDGVRVVSVLTGSPAEGVLQAGDVVVRAEGEPIETSEDLQQVVVANGDDPVDLAFRRSGERRTAEITPEVSPETGGPVIGVQIETVDPSITLPVPVEVDSGQIGGPSAGLLIALTVYDKVSEDVDLTDGRRIAGTGTIDREGVVGPIGSIAQKAITAHRRDADVFLVPASQEEEADVALPAASDLEVVGVATFDQAVEALTSPAADAFLPQSVLPQSGRGRLAILSASAAVSTGRVTGEVPRDAAP